MKKIYSFVLMAAMLLVGTNAWAATHEASTFGELKYYFEHAASGDVIQLTAGIEFGGDDVIWLGTGCINDEARSITLDLAGFDITREGAGASIEQHFFVLSHGELLVINSSETESVIGYTSGASSDGSTIFAVYGSYMPCENFSHLLIGEKVKLYMEAGCLGSAITVDALSKKAAHRRNSIARWASNDAVKYNTNILSGDEGYAFGVTVDVKGNIYNYGGASGSQKAYGIKTNGNLASPIANKSVVEPDYTTFTCMSASDFAGYSADVTKAPFVHVHKNCTIVTSNGSTRSAAIYASGYAKWLIEGDCSGNIGVSISSGEVDIDGAKIASTASTYKETTAAGGVSGSGSAIVINSRNNYAGDVDLTITGDAEITAAGGYAIEETVHTTSGGDKVEKIDIESAQITGGGKGAIVVTAGNVEDTYIYAADITGKIEQDNAGEKTDVSTSTNLGGLIKGTTTSDTNPQSFDSDKDYILNVNTTGDKPVIEVKPNTSKVVTMNASGYATFSATVERAIPANATVAAYTAVFDDAANELTLTKIANGIIPANTGVFMIGKVDSTYILSTSVTGASAPSHDLKPASEWSSTIGADGYYARTEINDIAYVLSGDLMYKYEGLKMKPNKAYFELTSGDPINAPKRVHMVIAETQDVENVEFEVVKAVKFIENGQVLIKRGEKVYNVQGQIVK